jgi:DNA-binding MarR family transcriptional regulator
MTSVHTARDTDQHTAAVLELLPLLHQLKAWARRVYTAELSERGLPLPALALLERCGVVRVSELASAARVDPSTVSRQVKALEAAGLVTRTADPVDGRVHRVELSDAGRQTLASGRRDVAASVTRHLADWDPVDLERLTEDLRRLMHDLDRNPSTTTDGIPS